MTSPKFEIVKIVDQFREEFAVSFCSIMPNLAFGNNIGNASSSHRLSVIRDAGCLFSPGALLSISLPLEVLNG